MAQKFIQEPELLFVPEPEPARLTFKDSEPDPTADPEPDSVDSDQVCEPVYMVIPERVLVV